MVRIAEDELIERIRRRIPSQKGGALRIGIGHDAAVIRPRGRDWVVTCDQFLEGVHFLADNIPPDSVGYKALALGHKRHRCDGGIRGSFYLVLHCPPNEPGLG